MWRRVNISSDILDAFRNEFLIKVWFGHTYYCMSDTLVQNFFFFVFFFLLMFWIIVAVLDYHGNGMVYLGIVCSLHYLSIVRDNSYYFTPSLLEDIGYPMGMQNEK